jgi:peptidoglycan/xylan/chitin deacetylase (PgdA/CDA1 family)
MIERLLRPPAVLVYHGVGRPKGDPKRLLTSPEHLESQIRFLKRRGYRFLTAEELLEQGGAGPGVAALTFDDGFENWVTEAVPLLRRLGVRATFYVCPGLFGEQHRSVEGAGGRPLDEEGAKALVESGMEVGSHSMSHPDLRKIDDGELAAELSESKGAVERITGDPCRTFAYP